MSIDLDDLLGPSHTAGILEPAVAPGPDLRERVEELRAGFERHVAARRLRYADESLKLAAWNTWMDAGGATGPEQPFVVHVYGMDDVYPARTWEEATLVAQSVNDSIVVLASTGSPSTAFAWATAYPTGYAYEAGVISREEQHNA